MMAVLSALSLFAIIFYVSTGFFIYRANTHSKLNRMFLFWCLSMAIWSFGYSFVYITTSYQHIWMKLSAFGWCFFGAIALNWVLLFVESPLIRHQFFNIALYIPGAAFLYMSVFLFGPGKTLPMWAVNLFYTGNFIYNFSFILLCIVVIFVWGFRNRSSLKKVKQTRILLLASISPFLLNLLTQTILPRFGVDIIPPIGHLYSLIMLYGVYYAIKHYRLFNVSPQILNDLIFSEIMDLVVLLSPEGKIQRMSASTGILLGYSEDELLDKPVTAIIEDKSFIEDIFSEEKRHAACRYTEIQCRTKTGDFLPVRISCIPLTVSKINESDGIILLGHDIRITKQLEKQVAEHKITMEKLKQSDMLFKDIFYKNSAVMYLLDCETLEIIDANSAARKFYGYSKEDFKHKHIMDLNGLSEAKMKDIINSLDEENNMLYFKHLAADGQWRDVEIHATPMMMDGRKMLISIVTDVTDRKKAEEQIFYLAYHDALTGLANRKYFYERLHMEMERALRKKEKAAVLFLDLDGFKMINDRYGHEAGDTLLVEVANRLKKILRETDTVARMGGDEFTLLITDISGRDAAEAVAKKILDTLNMPISLGEVSVYIPASVGISIFPDDGGDMNQLLHKADNEMYVEKNRKKETPLF